MDQFLPSRIWRRVTFREVGERSWRVARVEEAQARMLAGSVAGSRFDSAVREERISGMELREKERSIAVRRGPERRIGV